MNNLTSIEPVTEFKTRSAQLIKQAQTTRQPIVITQNGKATAVLQDVESYEKQRQALLLLKFLAQGDQELGKGKGVPHSRVKQRFADKLKELEGDE